MKSLPRPGWPCWSSGIRPNRHSYLFNHIVEDFLSFQIFVCYRKTTREILDFSSLTNDCESTPTQMVNEDRLSDICNEPRLRWQEIVTGKSVSNISHLIYWTGYKKMNIKNLFTCDGLLRHGEGKLENRSWVGDTKGKLPESGIIRQVA